MSDYLVYSTSTGIYAAHADPAVMSQPLPVATLSRVTTFDVNYENKTLIVVSNKQLRNVAFDIDDDSVDLVTTLNASGVFDTRL